MKTLVGLLLLASACNALPSGFHCTMDEQCAVSAVGSRCEKNGFCSHSDPVCTYGHRFDAADTFGDQCVGDLSGGKAPTIKLLSLPPATTSMTSASIGYALENAPANWYVDCRTDSARFAFLCPSSPYQVGDVGGDGPLTVGLHTVEFYADDGSGPHLSSPTSTYTWKVVAK